MGDRGFAMKYLLIVAVLGFSVLGIAIAVFALNKPTNTQAGAQGCTQNPKMVLDSTSKYDTMTIYQLKLINNCEGQNAFTVKVASLPDTPKFYNNWSWKFKNAEWNTPVTTDAFAGASDISLTIQVPMEESGIPQQIQEGVYQFFVVETALANDSGKKDKLELIYNVK